MAEQPIAIGVVGAGPWAAMVHAPVFAAGPETRLAGIWARRPEAAEKLAARHGAPAFEDLDALFAACDAVAFSVLADVQVEYAIRAAGAGKALLLEKPLAFTVDDAEAVAEAADAAGVPTMLMLSYRYADHVRDFLARAREFPSIGARATFIGGGFLPGSPFAFGWRLERGALLDLGPHILDLMEAAAGPIVEVRAAGDPLGFCALTARHASGCVSQVSLSGMVKRAQGKVEIELYGPEGEMTLDALGGGSFAETFANVRREFAAVVRSGRSHEFDVHRGVQLQRLIAEAEASLAHGR